MKGVGTLIYLSIVHGLLSLIQDRREREREREREKVREREEDRI